MEANLDMDNVTGHPANTQPAGITDKRGYAARWRFSTRHIDNLLAQGMPHFAVGKRRIRISVAEADAWMKERFGQRRLGPLQPDKTGRSATAGVAKREGQP
jgi:hypothetical protein